MTVRDFLTSLTLLSLAGTGYAGHWTEQIASVQCRGEHYCSHGAHGERYCGDYHYIDFTFSDGVVYEIDRGIYGEEACQIEGWRDQPLPKFDFKTKRSECIGTKFVFTPFNRLEVGRTLEFEVRGGGVELCLQNLRSGGQNPIEQEFRSTQSLAICHLPLPGELVWKITRALPGRTWHYTDFGASYSRCEKIKRDYPNWIVECKQVLLADEHPYDKRFVMDHYLFNDRGEVFQSHTMYQVSPERCGFH